MVIEGFQSNVEEFYQLSDCYVFPVAKEDTIVSPLSVLEAMACNLSVITSRCDGLVSFFAEGGGLIYADSEEGFLEAIRRLNGSPLNSPMTRDMISEYSWRHICDRIAFTYESMLNDRR